MNAPIGPSTPRPPLTRSAARRSLDPDPTSYSKAKDHGVKKRKTGHWKRAEVREERKNISQLSNIVTSQPQCLCLLLNNTAASFYGYNVNPTLALALPTICNVKTPPLSRCNAAPAPAESPSESPDNDESPAVPTTPSGPMFHLAQGLKQFLKETDQA